MQVKRYSNRRLQQVSLACLAVSMAALCALAPPASSAAQAVRPECGPPLFVCSRDDSKVTQPNATPVPNFGGPHGAGTVVHDPLYNDVEIVRCTDGFTNPSAPNASYAVGLGGAGDKNSWNTDDTLLQVNGAGGVQFIFWFDPKAKSCRPVCADGSRDLHCGTGGLYFARPGVFSRVDRYKYYAFPSGLSHGTRVSAVYLTPGNPPSRPTPVADFAPALYKGNNPTWSAETRVYLGDVIQPKRNNDAGFELFQAVVAGITGKDEPSWTNTVEPYRSRNHTALPLPLWPGAKQTVDPEVKIQPLIASNAGKFIFKSTVSGTTGSGEPPWCQSPGCRVKDGSVVWTNMNASATISDGSVTWIKVGRTETETWISVAGVENNDHVFGMGVSYSNPTSPQDSGLWLVAYNNNENKIYQLNTYTKIETDYVCESGEGFDCRGGTWKRLASMRVDSPDSITVHSTSMSLDGKGMGVACGTWAGPCGAGINKIWHFGTGTWGEMGKDGDGHSVLGYTHFVNDGAGVSADAPSQKYLTIRSQREGNSVFPMWKFSPCSDVLQTTPPFKHPPCYPQFGMHLSWVYNRGRDEEPLIGATYVHGNRYPASSPWQYEIIGISACGRDGEPSCPAGYPSNKIWRFGRTFNFDYKPGGLDFYALASIGSLAQSGRYYALTSMGLGTLGGRDGSKNCRQGFSWSKSFAYSDGTQVTPHTSNPRNLTFAAQCERNCTSGTKEPEWPQDGSTSVRDGEVVWVPIGRTNCRSDVLIYKLQ
jgi:hypothetical protein